METVKVNENKELFDHNLDSQNDSYQKHGVWLIVLFYLVPIIAMYFGGAPFWWSFALLVSNFTMGTIGLILFLRSRKILGGKDWMGDWMRCMFG